LNASLIASWWVTILIFGLIGWPITYTLLRHLPDRGFAFIRPIGLLFTGYVLWLGGSFRILQNNIGGILVAILIVLIVGLVWYNQQQKKHQFPSMIAWVKQEWPYIIAVEVLFNLAFIAWVIFKSYNPNIETAGGEKWMEIAFINGTLRSPYFPPQDPWLSNFAISYYYFGYVLMAMVTQLTGIVSTTAFNLYIPTLFAMVLTTSFGVVANMVWLYQYQQQTSTNPKSAPTDNDSIINPPYLKYTHKRFPVIGTGLLAALFVGFLGNLIGVLEVLHKKGDILPASFWTWLDIRDLKRLPVASDSWIPDRFIWWWRGSRVLTDYNLTGGEQEVIDEFPFFSFLLGDVHPHVLALPFVLLTVAFALNLLATPHINTKTEPAKASLNLVDKLQQLFKDSWQALQTAVGGRFGLLLYALTIGGLGFLNTWDFPIYLGIVALTLLAWLAHQHNDWREAIPTTVVTTAILTLLSLLLYLPFYLTFQSQAGGILPNLWNPTRLTHFFVFFGPFLVGVSGLLIALAQQQTAWKINLRWTTPLMLVGPPLVMFFVLGLVMLSPTGRGFIDGIINDSQIQQVIGGASLSNLLETSLWRRVTTPWTFILLSILLSVVVALLVGFTQTESNTPVSNKTLFITEKFVLILAFMGLILPLSVEFIFLRDNFGYRMNTVFKFYFQAWALLALVSAYAVYYVLRNYQTLLTHVWQLAMFILVIGGLFYPILAMADKTNYFRNEATLDGIHWVSQHHPGDYAAIKWLRNNAPNTAIILEAPSRDSYRYAGRVSALTGFPTLLGWGGHQRQWRGNYDEPTRREPDIEKIYRTVDPQQLLTLLDDYNITYVYVGSLERERYPPDGLQKFEYLMDIAFQHGDVVIYQTR